MRRRQLLAVLAMAPVMMQAGIPLRVLASFFVLADLVRQIGDTTVVVDSLVGPDEDVHIYDPRPRDLRTLIAAGLLVRNGLGLEGWMEDRLTSAVGFRGKVVVTTDKVVPRTMKEKGLSAADPVNASAYRDNLRVCSARIADKDDWIVSALTPLPMA